MNNGGRQNLTSTRENAEGNSVAPILEAEQHCELVSTNDLMTSNGEVQVGLGHGLAELSRKRTKSTTYYGDRKRDCGETAWSEGELTSIEKAADEVRQSFEPQRQQNATSLIDATLVNLHNGDADQHIHDGAGTNGASSVDLASHGTLTRATKGYNTNGVELEISAVETFSSPLQVAKQNSTVQVISANGASENDQKLTANLAHARPKFKQSEITSVLYNSTGGSSKRLPKSMETIESIRLGLDRDPIPKKTSPSIRKQGRQPTISKSANSYKSGSYLFAQSSLSNDIQVGHSAKVIDFRSDTCSLPTEGMRDAICRAEVGDAVYGEDPSVLALEKKSAKLFQKEAACFLPSGTMSNLIAILVHCNKRGSEIITGSCSHILLFEQAGVAQFGGINIREIQNNPDGTFSLDELKTKIRVEDPHTPYTSLICVENTHNILGGKVLPQQWVDELCAYAKSVNLPVHMDGARIFGASAKLKIPVCEITRNVDTVTYCVSKNLGAPYGAVLLGSKEFIKKARRVMKALGGGVRQIGFMAAAGLYALENMVERLSDDHYHVQMIANAIRELNSPHVQVLPPEDIHTNILMIRLNSPKVTPIEFVSMLSTIHDDEEDPVMIKSFAMDKENVRFVLCNNNSKSDVEDAIRKIRFVINKIG